LTELPAYVINAVSRSSSGSLPQWLKNKIPRHNIMNDSRSAASEQSASLGKMECPHCEKDFQVRSLFKHIRLNHFSEFLGSINESKCKLNSDPEAPLEVTWMKKNDFDEEELITIYACLSTDKTFVSSARVLSHFKKEKKAFTEHKKEMKKLFADIEKRKVRMQLEIDNSAVIRRWRKAIQDNDSCIAEAYWRNILWYNDAAWKVIKRAQEIFPYPALHTMHLQYETFNADKSNLQMWIDQLTEQEGKMFNLMGIKCMNHTRLTPHLKFFEQFTRTLLLHLMDSHTEFYRFYSFNSPDCVRIRPGDYTEEFFFIANERMPSMIERLEEEDKLIDRLQEARATEIISA